MVAESDLEFCEICRIAYQPNPRSTPISVGLAGSSEAKRRLDLTVRNSNVLNYVQSGREGDRSWLWRRLAPRR